MDRAFNFFLERLLAADLHHCTEQNSTERLDSTQDQHAEQQQTVLVLLAQSLPLQRALELSKNNRVIFPLPKVI